jgi:molybdenum cofactor cytidylyltransferase
MEKSDLVGFVLAAGDGVRMGGSKALLSLDGSSGVRAHAARLREGGCKRVVAAVRASVLDSLGVVKEARLVVSGAEDQAGSLAIALREEKLLPDVIVLVTPVDAAPAGQATLERLVKEVEKGALAATPRFEGKSGHPIACRRSVLEVYTRASASYPPLREVLRGLGSARVRVDVSDPRVVVDLDTPEDVVALTGERPRFVESPDKKTSPK